MKQAGASFRAQITINAGVDDVGCVLKIVSNGGEGQSTDNGLMNGSSIVVVKVLQGESRQTEE